MTESFYQNGGKFIVFENSYMAFCFENNEFISDSSKCLTIMSSANVIFENFGEEKSFSTFEKSFGITIDTADNDIEGNGYYSTFDYFYFGKLGIEVCNSIDRKICKNDMVLINSFENQIQFGG